MPPREKTSAAEEERKQRALEKARLRKKTFDDRRRNLDNSDGASQRSGAVFHLSDAAREVLRQNRLRRRAAGLPPVLDSDLVESLLLAYGRQGEPGFQSGALVIDETKANPVTEKLVAKVEDLQGELRSNRDALSAAEATIKNHEEDAEVEEQFRVFDWGEVEQNLLAAHRLIGSAGMPGIVERVLDKAAPRSGRAEAAAVLQREIEEHIRLLVDWASRWG